MSLALLDRAHIRIDALYTRLPTRLCAALDIVALTTLTGFVLAVTWFGFGVLESSFEYGSRSNTSLQVRLWIPQALWLGGFVLFCLTALLLLAHAVTALVRGDTSAIGRLAGIRTLREEVPDEVDALLPGPAPR